MNKKSVKSVISEKREYSRFSDFTVIQFDYYYNWLIFMPYYKSVMGL